MGWPTAPNRLIGLSAGLDDAQADDACLRVDHGEVVPAGVMFVTTEIQDLTGRQERCMDGDHLRIGLLGRGPSTVGDQKRLHRHLLQDTSVHSGANRKIRR